MNVLNLCQSVYQNVGSKMRLPEFSCIVRFFKKKFDVSLGYISDFFDDQEYSEAIFKS